MRLVHTSKLILQEFIGDTIPPYAILSHRWEQDEVRFMIYRLEPDEKALEPLVGGRSRVAAKRQRLMAGNMSLVKSVYRIICNVLIR